MPAGDLHKIAASPPRKALFPTQHSDPIIVTEQNPTYFELARSWADERDATGRRSRRLAWTIASLAVCVAVLEAVALAVLVPLKTTVPMAVLVDRTTGHVERVDPNGIATIAADEALRESLLAQYVTARESYDPISANAAFRQVSLWSSGRAARGYTTQINSRPPWSALAQRGDAVAIAARVKSVSLLDPGRALVRYEVGTVGNDGILSDRAPYMATIRFAFRGEPMRIEDRLQNPLGFEVQSYRTDAEVPTDDLATGAGVPSDGERS